MLNDEEKNCNTCSLLAFILCCILTLSNWVSMDWLLNMFESIHWYMFTIFESFSKLAMNKTKTL